MKPCLHGCAPRQEYSPQRWDRACLQKDPERTIFSRFQSIRRSHQARHRPTDLPDGQSRIFSCIADTACERAFFHQLRIALAAPRLSSSAVYSRSSISQAKTRWASIDHVVPYGNANYEIIGVVADTLHKGGPASDGDNVLPRIERRQWSAIDPGGTNGVRSAGAFRTDPKSRLRNSILSFRFLMCFTMQQIIAQSSWQCQSEREPCPLRSQCCRWCWCP